MARLFDNASLEYLEVNSAIVSDFPLTMACWFNVDTFANQTLMSVTDISTSNEFIELRLRDPADNDVIALNELGVPFAFASTSSSYTLNTSHHACGVFASATDRRIFLDGASKGTNATSVAAPSALDTTAIGRLSLSSPTQYVSGSVAEAGAWNIALTDAEVAILALGYSPLLIRPENLIFYVPLVRDTDEDIIGGLSLTAFNTPSISNHPRIIYPYSPQIITAAAAAPPVGARPQGPLGHPLIGAFGGPIG